MTDLTPYDPRPATPASAVASPTGGRLVAWADGLAAALRMGTALAKTTFAPAAFRNNPNECAAAILYGDEIGLTPTQALQSIFVIGGRPGLYARAMVAVVMSAGHEVWLVEESPDKVTVAGKRKGSSHEVQSTWTKARAQRAGYLSNKKYETDPQAMLYARAASDVCRKVAPDALAGLAYSVEEMELEAPAETTTVSRSRSGAQKVSRSKPEPIAPPEPEMDEPPAEDIGEVAVIEQPAGITDAQMRKIQAGMKDLGITERDTALEYVRRVVGRDVESRNELTKDEASRLIEAIQADLDQS